MSICKGQSRPNERNGSWKGDKVSYKVLHAYLRRHMAKPDRCEICKKVPPYDLANITGIYNREFENWKWYCRRCHLISDGRIYNNLANTEKRSLAIKKAWSVNKRRITDKTYWKCMDCSKQYGDYSSAARHFRLNHKEGMTRKHLNRDIQVYNIRRFN